MVTPPSRAVQTKRAKRGSGAAGRDKSKEKNRKNSNGEANRKAAGLIAAEIDPPDVWLQRQDSASQNLDGNDQD